MVWVAITPTPYPCLTHRRMYMYSEASILHQSDAMGDCAARMVGGALAVHLAAHLQRITARNHMHGPGRRCCSAALAGGGGVPCNGTAFQC